MRQTSPPSPPRPLPLLPRVRLLLYRATQINRNLPSVLGPTPPHRCLSLAQRKRRPPRSAASEFSIPWEQGMVVGTLSTGEISLFFVFCLEPVYDGRLTVSVSESGLPYVYVIVGER